MGARRQSPEENLPQILDAGYEEHDTHIDDDQDAIEREILAEAGASENQVQYEIRVFRIPDSGNTYPSLFTIPGENVAGIRDRLADEYGTGHYELRVYKNKTLYRRLRIKIELPRTKPQPVANSAGDAVAQAVLQQGQMLQRLLDRVTTMPPPPPPPQQNMMEMFAAMGAMAKAMRDIAGPPPVATNPMEIFTSAISMAKELSSDGKEMGVMDLVGKFLESDVMKSVVQNLQPAQPPQQSQRALAPPTHTPNVAAPSAPRPQAPAATVPPEDPNAKAFNDLLMLLVSRAEKNSDPILYADFIEDAVAPEMLAQLLAQPDPVGMLALYNPAIATYREWFTQVIEALTDPGEGETTGGAPNPSAPASNAAVERSPASSPSKPA